jgi:diguanylate cyclase (GGDEF)-like protein
MTANYATLDDIYELTSTVGLVRGKILKLVSVSAAQTAAITVLLKAAGEEYHQRAERSRIQAIAGSAAIILLLFGAVAFFYSRSRRLTDERARALAASRHEALTDALTGLSNRRALVADLERQAPAVGAGEEMLVALYDLDGFKGYNDSFGHAAGDALLVRFGERLAEAAGTTGAAYRLGGDEFCVTVTFESFAAGTALLERCATALTESGQLFEVGCSYGAAVMPTEATTADEALRLSDQRMYASKSSRSSAGRESTDVLLKVLDEQTVGLLHHVHDVAELARMTGVELGLEPSEIITLERAAELHDIGKCAIPDAVLDKPGPLDPAEWEFMRQHTLVGERIVLAAPSLAEAAPLIRSSHERFDGSGYPEGLVGAEIPLGARIIAVCDAYDAMTSKRSYSEAIASEEALTELDRCAGQQFDLEVVQAFRAGLFGAHPRFSTLPRVQ